MFHVTHSPAGHHRPPPLKPLQYLPGSPAAPPRRPPAHVKVSVAHAHRHPRPGVTELRPLAFLPSPPPPSQQPAAAAGAASGQFTVVLSPRGSTRPPLRALQPPLPQQQQQHHPFRPLSGAAVRGPQLVTLGDVAAERPQPQPQPQPLVEDKRLSPRRGSGSSLRAPLLPQQAAAAAGVPHGPTEVRLGGTSLREETAVHFATPPRAAAVAAAEQQETALLNPSSHATLPPSRSDGGAARNAETLRLQVEVLQLALYESQQENRRLKVPTHAAAVVGSPHQHAFTPSPAAHGGGGGAGSPAYATPVPHGFAVDAATPGWPGVDAAAAAGDELLLLSSVGAPPPGAAAPVPGGGDGFQYRVRNIKDTQRSMLQALRSQSNLAQKMQRHVGGGGGGGVGGVFASTPPAAFHNHHHHHHQRRQQYSDAAASPQRVSTFF